jgi:hypothetical protein
MALFVEVNSVEKQCPVIINLDHIVEIAPLASGGCALFTTDGAGMNSRSSMKVEDSYEQFKQFAMQTVSAEDIARRFPKTEKEAIDLPQLTKVTKAPTKKTVDAPLEIPKL